MSGMFLGVAIENARFMIPRGIRELLAGPLTPHVHIHDICTFFRQRGIASMLRDGVPDSYHIASMQSASAFAMELRRAPENAKVTSFARPLFDAISSGYWDAATDIASTSRRTWNPDFEYEDDFLYVEVWVQLLLGAPASEISQTTRRYADVLDGAGDVRFDVVTALVALDPDAFDSALRRLLDARKVEADELARRRAMGADTAAWVQNFALEGAALLKFAERLGIVTTNDYLHCPSIVRPDSPFAYDPNAWRVPEPVFPRRIP